MERKSLPIKILRSPSLKRKAKVALSERVRIVFINYYSSPGLIMLMKFSGFLLIGRVSLVDL